MPTLLLVLVALVAGAGYLIACRIWPYSSCLRCHGDGKLRSPGGKSWRRCKRCRGTGAQLRIGRRMLNRMSSSAERSSR